MFRGVWLTATKTGGRIISEKLVQENANMLKAMPARIKIFFIVSPRNRKIRKIYISFSMNKILNFVPLVQHRHYFMYYREGANNEFTEHFRHHTSGGWDSGVFGRLERVQFHD